VEVDSVGGFSGYGGGGLQWVAEPGGGGHIFTVSPNWDISRGFLYIFLSCDERGGRIIFRNFGAQWKGTPSYCDNMCII
jgi:hypothetical protein